MKQHDEMVARCNRVLEDLYERTKLRTLPHFGSDMLLLDDRDIFRTTIAHRILSKFQRPDPSVTRRLTSECYEGWLQFEEHLKSHDFYRFEASARSVSYQARELIHRWWNQYAPAFSLADVDIEFTPGETFTSKRGRVSVFQKLADKKCWTVTYDAADDFIRLCYNNLSLKRCARKHFPYESKQQYRKLYDFFKNEKHVGFAVFRYLMYTHVLTLVHGSRASSVEKNNEKRRFINIEALGNMLLQRVEAQRIRFVLECVGNVLGSPTDKTESDGQARHRKMISDPSVSTIDFSNASDSTLLRYCKMQLPSDLFRGLNRYRSPMVLINQVYYLPEKISSMGNGFTFEVMSLLLLGLARVLDPKASVYGDDVIIHNDVADRFIAAAQAAGYNVNNKKTFIRSRFRESCGAFYLDGYGYITSYDIHWCDTPKDVVTTANKLRRIRDASGLDVDVIQDIDMAYRAILNLIPASLKGPVSHSPDLPEWVECDVQQAAKSHKRDAERRGLFTMLKCRYSHFIDGLQYDVNDFFILDVPVIELRDASKATRKLSNQGFKYAHYLYSGMRTRDLRRGTDFVSYHRLLVHRSGFSITFQDLKRHGGFCFTEAFL